jgi:hypothetical protein
VARRSTKMKMLFAVVAVVATMVSGATTVAFAQEEAEEIAVTGVVTYQGAKADGTPVYGITDESTLGGERNQKAGYLMEGDYSAYVGQRITVHGVPGGDHAERVLDVTRIEGPQ